MKKVNGRLIPDSWEENNDYAGVKAINTLLTELSALLSETVDAGLGDTVVGGTLDVSGAITATGAAHTLNQVTVHPLTNTSGGISIVDSDTNAKNAVMNLDVAASNLLDISASGKAGITIGAYDVSTTAGTGYAKCDINGTSYYLALYSLAP